MYIRLRLLDVPLDRDEGGYAYAGRLILDGIMPFKGVSDLHMPGLYGVYAVIFLIIGDTVSDIHTGLLIINFGTVLLVFFLSRKLFNTITSLAACCAFAVMSISQTVEGFSANTEAFLIFPALAGLLLLLLAIQNERLITFFLSGTLLGIALLLKQQGLFQIAVGMAYYPVVSIFQRKLDKGFIIKYAMYLAGVSIPFLLLCFFFWRIGVFNIFWYWVFEHSLNYATDVRVSNGIALFRAGISDFFTATLAIWTLAGIGFISFIWNRKDKEKLMFTTLFFLFSLLSTIPGFSFQRHYWILLLPSLALMSGIGIDFICSFFTPKDNIKNSLAAFLIFCSVMYTVVYEKAYLFQHSPERISWSSFMLNAFPTSEAIADYIKKRALPQDCIAVLGSEPQIIFHTGLRSATPYIWLYGLMEPGDKPRMMQQEMIGDIEKAAPRFIVYVSNPISWMSRSYSNQDLFKWLKRYVPENYTRSAVVDILSMDKQIFLSGVKARMYRPRSKYWIGIYEKISKPQ